MGRAGCGMSVLALVLLLAVPLSFSVGPFSEASFKTFISLSSNGTQVSAMVTYFNMSYYNKLNESKINALDQSNKLFKPDVFSNTSLTGGVFEFNNSSISFTFEGQAITDASGNKVCDPLYTDQHGRVTCKITHYKDKNGNIVSIETAATCGYVKVEVPPQFKGSTEFQSSSSTITVCPKNNLAISSLAPAIIAALSRSQNLLVCFPALLIAGVLMASMYYSGRDPLSLFDITTPRLPKVQSFKVKTAPGAPQMLRQVLRRHKIMQDKAKRTTTRMLLSLVKRSDAYKGASLMEKFKQRREAKQLVRDFYKEVDLLFRKASIDGAGGLSHQDIAGLSRKFSSMMKGRKPGNLKNWNKAQQNAWLKVYKKGVHNWQVYIQSKQAVALMGAARGGTGKGNILQRMLNKPFEYVGKKSVEFDESNAVRFLGKVPVVRKLVAMPGKAVDVALQFRSSRRGIVSIGRELKGGLFYKAGHNKLGEQRGTYSLLKKAFVKKDAEGNEKDTRLGKINKWFTGWTWTEFEGRHNAKKIKKEMDKLAANGQHHLDQHNITYSRLVDLLTQGPKEAHSKLEEMSNKKLEKIESKLKKALNNAEAAGNKAEVARLSAALTTLESIRKAMGSSDTRDGIFKMRGLLDNLSAMNQKGKEDIVSAADMKGLLTSHVAMTEALSYLNKLNEIQKKAGIYGQARTLEELHKKHLAWLKQQKDRGAYSIQGIEKEISKFGLAEKEIRKEFEMVRFANGRYSLFDKNGVEKDLSMNGMSENDLKKKYGKTVANDVGLYHALAEARAVDVKNGAQLTETLNKIRKLISESQHMTAQEKQDRITAVDGLIAKYGSKEKIKWGDRLEFLRGLDSIGKYNFFKAIDRMEDRMGEYVRSGKPARLEKLYDSIHESLNSKVTALDKKDPDSIVAKMSAFGKNPSELMYTWYLEGMLDKKNEKLMERLKAAGMTFEQFETEFKKFLYDRDGKPVIKSSDVFEKNFNPGYGGKNAQNFQQLLGLLTGKKPETAFVDINYKVMNMLVNWEARQFAAESFISGKVMSIREARDSLLLKSAVKKELDHAHERAAYRAEGGYSQYESPRVDRSLSYVRTLEKLSGWVVSSHWGGASRGENVLGLLKQTREFNGGLMGRYGAFFHQLTNYKGKFYDQEFVDSIRKSNKELADRLGLMSAQELKDENKRKAYDQKFAKNEYAPISNDAYKLLMGRGLTWHDIKNGLPFIMSSEGRHLPMLEYRKDVLAKQEKGIVILDPKYNNDKGDVRDLAPLYSMTPASMYSTRQVGTVILREFTDPKTGETRWLYADPKKGFTEGAYHTAEKHMDLRTEISKSLAGVSKEGMPVSGKEAIRVITTHDLAKYAGKKGYENIFGQYTMPLQAKEWARGKVYGAGMGLSDYIYTSISQRTKRLEAWYNAQYQIRQTLQRMEMEERSWMTSGKERFSIFTKSGEYGDEGKEMKGSAGDEIWKKVRSSDKVKIDQPKLDDVSNRVLREAAKIEKGDDTFLGNMRAAYYNWRRSIASDRLSEIAGEEAKWYAAKTELKALEKLGASGAGLSREEYSQLHGALSSQLKDFKSDYKEAKKDFGAINKSVIEWIGSHGDIYTPQRNLMTMGLFGKMFGSYFVQGEFQNYYQITESSVMRDPRIAIGGGAPGFDWTKDVGYNTGQNVYERSRFWATNSLWEKNMQLPLAFVYPVHKWWNDKISFVSRISSGYPGPVQGSQIYATDWEKPHYSAWFSFPFGGKHYSDYHTSRIQDALNFTGISNILRAYQVTGSSYRGSEDRNMLRRALDALGDQSDHYNDTQFRTAPMQRYQDQLSHKNLKAVEEYLHVYGKDRVTVDYTGEPVEKTIAEVRQDMQNYFNQGEDDKYHAALKAFSDTIGQHLNVKDSRGTYVRTMLSGSDMSDDGSRGRFLDMYTMFHANIWNPTVPGMFAADPLTGEWHAFSRIARRVYEAESGTRMSNLASFYSPEISFERKVDTDNKEYFEPKITYVDRFTTFQDAMSQNYKEDTTALLQLMKQQNKELAYSAMNLMSTAFYNPLLFSGIGGKGLYKRLTKNTSFGATYTEMAVKEGIYGGDENFKEMVRSNTGYDYADIEIGHGHAAHGTAAGQNASKLAKVGQSIKNRLASFEHSFQEFEKRKKRERQESDTDELKLGLAESDQALEISYSKRKY